jgi:hypothetical protein
MRFMIISRGIAPRSGPTLPCRLRRRRTCRRQINALAAHSSQIELFAVLAAARRPGSDTSNYRGERNASGPTIMGSRQMHEFRDPKTLAPAS